MKTAKRTEMVAPNLRRRALLLMSAIASLLSLVRSVRYIVGVSTGLAIGAALYAVSRVNYLLFHTLTELFAIAVAWSVFMLVWNARAFIRNDALVLLGTAYLFTGFLDLLHTLAYKGMGVFPYPDASNLATQFWIAGRWMEAVSLLLFAILTGREPLRVALAFGLYGMTTAVISAASLVLRN